jgi:hypothetical protein
MLYLRASRRCLEFRVVSQPRDGLAGPPPAVRRKLRVGVLPRHALAGRPLELQVRVHCREPRCGLGQFAATGIGNPKWRGREGLNRPLMTHELIPLLFVVRAYCRACWSWSERQREAAGPRSTMRRQRLCSEIPLKSESGFICEERSSPRAARQVRGRLPSSKSDKYVVAVREACTLLLLINRFSQ